MKNKNVLTDESRTQALNKKRIKDSAAKLNNQWVIEKSSKKLVKTFNFSDFNKAIKFVNKVARLANSEDHHPDIIIHSYNQVRIELFTHTVGGLQEKDFLLAEKIDKL